MRRIALPLSGLVIAAAILSACEKPKAPAEMAAEGPAITVAPAAVTSPAVSVARLEDLPQPLPTPYDETVTPAQMNAAIDAAFIKAKAEDKRVILDMGGNWCSWCRMLSGVMSLAEVKPFLDANFVIVPVGVSSKQGLRDQNMDVLKRFNIAEVKATPWLVVLEPDGKVLHSGYEVTDKDHHTPQAMVDWIAQFAKRPNTTISQGAPVSPEGNV